jgi:hypothetical protein
MNSEKYLRRFTISLLCMGLATPGLWAADNGATAMVGAIVGMVKNGANLPVAGVTVTAIRADGSGVRATLSGSEGIYSFADLPTGKWSLNAQAEGFQKLTLPSLDVAGGEATRADLSLNPAGVMVSSLTTPTEPSLAPPAASENILRRLANGAKVTVKDLDKYYADKEAERQAKASTASLGMPPVDAFSRPAPAPVPVPAPAFPTAPAPAPQPAPAPAAAPSKLPEALEAPDAAPAVDNETPFAFGDFTWLNGTPRNKDTVLDTKFFTPEVRFDTEFMEDFNQPMDHTIVGATESFRSGEVQIEQASVGGDFHWQNVRGRILFMNGLFATTTPRNDASSATGSAPGNTGGVGQWDLQNAYKYVSEAYGGYHFNVNHGLNVDAGIFVSYIGLFSYYNFDNWTYQPSYVSSNTPWFFNGVRTQWFPTQKLKIEPWFINGWQSYAKFNGHPGLGGQLLWMPKEWFKLVANQYGYGEDNLGLPHTQRIHTDDSIEVRFYNNQNNGSGISKFAISVTGDAGCQYGGGITCHGGPNKSDFLGWMFYNRVWWGHDKYALTLGGGQMNNPGRYLTLLPPIDGAWAASGTPYFTENPGQNAHMWDSTLTFQYMPKQYITWWMEAGYRHSDIPYFAGRGGVTPPGGNNGLPQYYTCMSGASAMTNVLANAEAACGGGLSSVWFPDLRRSEAKLSAGVMVKF